MATISQQSAIELVHSRFDRTQAPFVDVLVDCSESCFPFVVFRNDLPMAFAYGFPVVIFPVASREFSPPWPWQGTQHDRQTIDAEGDPQSRALAGSSRFPQEDRCLNMVNDG